MGDLLTFLSPQELDSIRTDFREIILNIDSVLYGQPPSRPITFIYRRFLSQTTDMSSGAVVATWEDTRIDGFGGFLAKRDITVDEYKMQVGDQFVMFDPTKLKAPPTNDDRILLYVTFDGTVSLDSGSATVTGFNTEFIRDGVQGGDLLLDCDVTNSILEIASIQSKTSLTLRSAWTGADLPYLKYEIFRAHSIIDNKADPLGALTRLGLRRAGS